MNQSSATSVIENIFEYLGRRFPVACTSDEFTYFPQVQLPEPEWNIWDYFSSDAINETVQRLSVWEDELGLLGSTRLDLQLQIDIRLLKRVMRSLREQLAEVRSWELQPTLYLTIACTGLAQAVESEDPAAIHERAKTLPAFLDQARHNLTKVPVLFRDIGLEMVSDTRNYLVTLLESLPELKSVLEALDSFENELRRVPTYAHFLLQRDLLERVLRFHLHCDIDIQDIVNALDQEIGDVQSILVKEARGLLSEESTTSYSQRIWLDAFRNVPVPLVSKRELVRLYEEEICKLAENCAAQGFVSPDLVSSCPVSVLAMPEFFSAIRVGASYSIPPKYPPSGGKFYIAVRHSTDESRRASLREYRMTCAHETYPGHHLLDCSRWSLKRPLRRNIEYPTFYEGWACFAEELMRLTGYFAKPEDRLLLARRRFVRAIRGKVDIGLQMGALDFTTAVKYLEKTGIGTERAKLLARKYPLNPGYQLCYTIGLRRFLNMWHQYSNGGLTKFVRAIFNQGEILFTDLEEILRSHE